MLPNRMRRHHMCKRSRTKSDRRHQGANSQLMVVKLISRHARNVEPRKNSFDKAHDEGDDGQQC
jgi:hypothetical protein